MGCKVFLVVVVFFFFIDIWFRCFFLPHLICWVSCLWMLQRKNKEGRRREKDFFSISTLFYLGFSHRYSVARNVILNYLRTVVSPKSGSEMYLSFPVVNKSKFSVVISSGGFMWHSSACRLASSRHNLYVEPSASSQKSFQSEGSCSSEGESPPFTGMVHFRTSVVAFQVRSFWEFLHFFFKIYFYFLFLFYIHCKGYISGFF